jgi:hypothetical protein
MIRSLARLKCALANRAHHQRWMAGAVSVSLSLAMLDAAVAPTFAYEPLAGTSVSTVADDSEAPAQLEVLGQADDTSAQPDTHAGPAPADTTPASEKVDPCTAPYDRPEVACTLSNGAVTSGSVSPETHRSVYRFSVATPGTLIQAELMQESTPLEMFLVGPGDQVLAESDTQDDSPDVVSATIVVPGTHAVYVVDHPASPTTGTGEATYSLQFLAQPPIANTEVPRLPELEADAAPQQCPQAEIKEDDRLVGLRMGIYMAPNGPLEPAPDPGGAGTVGAGSGAGGTASVTKVGGQVDTGADNGGKPSTTAPTSTAKSDAGPTAVVGSPSSPGGTSPSGPGSPTGNSPSASAVPAGNSQSGLSSGNGGTVSGTSVRGQVVTSAANGGNPSTTAPATTTKSDSAAGPGGGTQSVPLPPTTNQGTVTTASGTSQVTSVPAAPLSSANSAPSRSAAPAANIAANSGPPPQSSAQQPHPQSAAPPAIQNTQAAPAPSLQSPAQAC